MMPHDATVPKITWMHLRAASILLFTIFLYHCEQYKRIEEIPAPFLTVLKKEESLQSQYAPGYLKPSAGNLFEPTGIVFAEQGNEFWLYTRTHGNIRHFIQTPQSFQLADETSAPTNLIRCIYYRVLYCSNAENIWRLTKDGFTPVMKRRFGYADFYHDVHGNRLIALNNLRNELIAVSPDGTEQRLKSLSPGAYAIGHAGAGKAWIAFHVNRRLVVIDSATGTELAMRQLNAPVRAAEYDAAHDYLWTVGPEDSPVTRKHGIIQNLRTAIYAYDFQLKRQREVIWNDAQLIDGTALDIRQNKIRVTATGSARLWVYDIASGRTEKLTTGAGPVAVTEHSGKSYVVNLLSQTIDIFAGAQRTDTIVASAAAMDAERLGRYLFYQTGMWQNSKENAYTCNSCHWNGLSDHRMHPGFHESRYELTRPVAGIALSRPVFTPMQAETLSEAIEGLFRGLDVRYWQKQNQQSPPYYLRDIVVDLGYDKRQTLSAHAARSALLTTLMRWPVEQPLARKPGIPLSERARRGSNTFARDCARCHEPADSMRTRKFLPLSTLKHRPLVFGAPLYARTGAAPYYTPHGNRISPLINLARGGPFFSDGSAADLSAVVERSNPQADEIHAPGNFPYYNEETRTDLVAFLQEI